MNTDYRLVTDVQGIREYIGDAADVAFDIETAPDDGFREEEKAALDPAKAHITGCSFSKEEGTGIYVPVAHLRGKNIYKEDFFAFMEEFLTSSSINKIAHNIAFEAAFFYSCGIIIQAPCYDTMCAAQMTLKSSYEFRKLNESGLKRLAGDICKEPLPSFTSVTDGKYFDELDAQDSETVRYGCADSDFALRLYHIFKNWFERFLPKHGRIVAEMESPTAVYIGIMRVNGVPMDIPLMQARQEEARKEMARIKDEIQMMIGDIEIGANCSTNAFKNYLFKTLKLPVLKTTESNREAADDASMILLQDWCRGNRPELAPLFSLVQEYRKWGKILSTYLVGYSKFLNSVTGRIHPNMMALSTDTGRFSCNSPNLQNMPRATNDPVGIRSLVKAPDGMVIVSCDFSQIELRVGAFYCRDEAMLRTYRTGGDIHAMTTSVIFGCTYEEAQDKHRDGYKEQRTIAKNVNFGTFYGLFPKGLQKTLKFKAGVEKSFEECAEIIDNLKAGYKGLTAWQDETKALAARRMYSETWLGRRRYLPNIQSDDWGKKSFAERCALNTPIQGTAADILKMAIVRLLRGLPKHGYLKPVLQIHDELTFLVPEGKVTEAVAFIRECMEEQPFPEFDLPLVAEASVGRTFGEMEELGD